MSAWQMSPAYKVWLVCGMGTIVAVMVALGLNDPGNQDLVFVALGMVGIYLAGIFFFQFRGWPRPDRGRRARRLPAHAEAASRRATRRAEWQSLMRELAVKPLDPAAQRAATAGDDRRGALAAQVRRRALRRDPRRDGAVLRRRRRRPAPVRRGRPGLPGRADPGLRPDRLRRAADPVHARRGARRPATPTSSRSASR